MNTIYDYKVLSTMKKKFNYFENTVRTMHQEFDDYDMDCDGIVSKQDLLNYFRNIVGVKMTNEIIFDLNDKICFYEYILSKLIGSNKLDEYVVERLKSLHKIYLDSLRQQNLYRSFNLYLLALIESERNIISSLFEIYNSINKDVHKNINIIRNDIINNHNLFGDYMNKNQLMEFLRNKKSFSLNFFRNELLSIKFS